MSAAGPMCSGGCSADGGTSVSEMAPGAVAPDVSVPGVSALSLVASASGPDVSGRSEPDCAAFDWGGFDSGALNSSDCRRSFALLKPCGSDVISYLRESLAPRLRCFVEASRRIRCPVRRYLRVFCAFDCRAQTPPRASGASVATILPRFSLRIFLTVNQPAGSVSTRFHHLMMHFPRGSRAKGKDQC